MQSNGQYSQLQPKAKQSGIQELLITLANERFDEAYISNTPKKAKKRF
jgi:hypothetical protein